MQVILVGPSAHRQQLRAQLPPDIEVIGDAPTMSAARTLGVRADAFLVADQADGALIEPLTPRELQVLQLVADGLPNKAVALRLAVSDETVKFHLAAVFGKLGASNRTDAVRLALRRGLIAM